MSDLIGSFLGIFNVAGQRAVAEANNRISAVNAEAGNKVRLARNAFGAAENNLARFAQSLNNNRVLKQGGQQLEANVVNYYRSRDQLLTQSFSDSIAQAEQAGHAVASAAAAGVGGSVVDMVNTSTRLRDSIVKQQLDERADQFTYDTSRRAGNILSQTLGGMDQSLILNNFDTGIDVAQVQAKPTYGAAILNFAIAAGKAYAGMSGVPTGGGNAPTSGTGVSVPSSSSSFRFNQPAPSYWGAPRLGNNADRVNSITSLWG